MASSFFMMILIKEIEDQKITGFFNSSHNAVIYVWNDHGWFQNRK
jgi:hypothetical protein